MHLICAKCQRQLTRSCRIGGSHEFRSDAQDRDPVVPSGVIVRWETAANSLVTSPDGSESLRHVSPIGAYSANPEDVIENALHSSGADNGCCGSDGLDGPNRSCVCGRVVATEWSDCWTRVEVRFEPDAVKQVD